MCGIFFAKLYQKSFYALSFANCRCRFGVLVPHNERGVELTGLGKKKLRKRRMPSAESQYL